MALSVIPHIIDQHAEEAAFLWQLRHNAVDAPHYDLTDLIKLDNRVAAHLDGLSIAGDYGARVCEMAMENPGPGEVFVSTVRALEEKNNQWLDHLFALVNAEPNLQTGLFAAFGWVSASRLQGTVAMLLASHDALKQLIGIEACVMHRVDPGKSLNHILMQPTDSELCARALRAAAELGRVDLLSTCDRYLDDQGEKCSFWAAWSTVLLGNRKKALDILYALAQTQNPYQEQSLKLILKLLPVPDAHALLKILAQDSINLRLVIQGAGIVGDPYYVPWLIKQMDDSQVARLAGESFSFITGLDLAYLDLEKDAPEEMLFGPNDNPAESDVSIDKDEDLAWPDASKIQVWWDANKHNFIYGQRYFMAGHVSREHCIETLNVGYQRQRHAAVLYLSILNPKTGLFPISAPGWRQKRWLGKITHEACTA